MAILVQESTFHVIWNGEFRMGISNISGEIWCICLALSPRSLQGFCVGFFREMRARLTNNRAEDARTHRLHLSFPVARRCHDDWENIIGHRYSLISSWPLTHWFVYTYLYRCNFMCSYITLMHCVYTYIDAANEDVSRKQENWNHQPRRVI
jgi:hypothetical protein